ncbi:betaine--homocysteine S-methyltransferase [Chloroflexi bacterium TSY]|nr:betaine--homocysteine S-methyltransferase [Chloroflexi bacterium TSY]
MITSKVRTLLENRPVLSDGAMGTMLQDLGLTDGGAPELWNVEHADRVQKVHQGYIDAGANMIETNTFGGTSARLKFHDIGDRVTELNRAGARIARDIAEPAGALVAGSIGPSGELIEPVGALTMDEAREMFQEQAMALAEGGVDLFLIETMSHLNEVEAAIQGARAAASELPIFVTMSFDTNFHTMMGVSPSQAVQTIANWGVEVIGANCGNGMDEVEVIMHEMAMSRPSGTYLLVHSNAGLPKFVDGEIKYDGTPERMADYAVSMRNLGIDIIGGCCGSTPEHILAMRNALDAVKGQPISGPDAPGKSNNQVEDADSRAKRSAARRQERRERVARG